MKNKLKKIFLLTLCSSVFALSGCDFGKKASEAAEDATHDTERKTNDAAEDAKNLTIVDTDGHFRNEKLYHFTNKELNTPVQIEYTFKTDGKLTTVNVSNNETVEYTYKVNGNLIEIKNTRTNKVEYMDYCDEVLYHPINSENPNRNGYASFVGGKIGYLDGVVISAKSSSSVVGYHIDLQMAVGENKAVFTTDKNSTKGFAYPIYANGTIKTGIKDSKAVDDSMIIAAVLDASKSGVQVIDVGIGKKTYKAALRVADAVTVEDKIDENGYFTAGKLFHYVSGENKFEYNFSGNGDLTVVNAWTDETTSFKYKVIDNLIEVKDSASKVSYFDYYTNVVFIPEYTDDYTFAKKGVCMYADGYAAALQSSSSILGYHMDLSVSVGDTKTVFTTSKSTTKGLAYPIYANATAKLDSSNSNVKTISKDAFANEIDTAAAGLKIVDLTFSSKQYKAVLRVAA